MAAQGPEDEVLVKVVGSADLIPANKVRVPCLEVERRDDVTRKDVITQARRMVGDQVDGPVRHPFLDRIPAGIIDFSLCITAYPGRHNAHLHPERMLTSGGAGRVELGWLTNNKQRHFG